jgi:protein phosphatase
LCSDGLIKELRSGEITRILSGGEPADVARHLVESACKAGGRDNVTAVVVDFHR